MDATYAVIL